MATLTDDQRAFIRDNAYAAVVTTLRKDGSPHSTVVWIDEDGGDVVFNTARGRAKDVHLKNDPRVSVLVVDPNDQYKWVAVSGRGEMTEEGADAHIDRLAKKYLDADSYPFRNAEEVRVIVRIAPEKVDSSGFES
ncbi:MAG TPA: PPOX class F420-dependent oxidoreductase [Gaiellaceae bacterium]|jgi:PPOX class probable F420-dependent enzyme|nr:PPOX class F420-dependent oxidoreductase [Gaiellaceae bacterium]